MSPTEPKSPGGCPTYLLATLCVSGVVGRGCVGVDCFGVAGTRPFGAHAQGVFCPHWATEGGPLLTSQVVCPLSALPPATTRNDRAPPATRQPANAGRVNRLRTTFRPRRSLTPPTLPAPDRCVPWTPLPPTRDPHSSPSGAPPGDVTHKQSTPATPPSSLSPRAPALAVVARQPLSCYRPRPPPPPPTTGVGAVTSASRPSGPLPTGT